MQLQLEPESLLLVVHHDNCGRTQRRLEPPQLPLHVVHRKNCCFTTLRGYKPAVQHRKDVYAETALVAVIP
jgi:hypothetical protein